MLSNKLFSFFFLFPSSKMKAIVDIYPSTRAYKIGRIRLVNWVGRQKIKWRRISVKGIGSSGSEIKSPSGVIESGDCRYSSPTLRNVFVCTKRNSCFDWNFFKRVNVKDRFMNSNYKTAVLSESGLILVLVERNI